MLTRHVAAVFVSLVYALLERPVMAQSVPQCSLVTAKEARALSIMPFFRPAPVGRLASEHRASSPQNSTCNCSQASLCRPLKGKARSEVLVWYVPGDGQTWQHYDWSTVTTIAVLQDIHQPVEQELVCYAHAHNVRVVWTYQAGCWDSLDECNWIGNATVRQNLIESLMSKITRESLDGVNLDIEGLTDNMVGMTSLTQDLSKRVHDQCAGCTVSVDLSPYPENVYSFTGYNWTALGEAADFVITMNYDMNDFGPHGGFAEANSPLPKVENIERCVLDNAFDQYVARDHLVMGFPWYAYYIQCDSVKPSPGSCYSAHAFSKVASQHSLADAILNKLPISHGGRQWDSIGQSPYFDVLNGTHRYQVRYDDPQSIKAKCLAAKSLGVRGVAFWTGNVDYGQPLPQAHIELEKEMWQAVVWP